ncbi:zinc finger protein 184-like [Ostrea edulis]|uniref:zinc finger protein 184-like n=1 Tax=Ostrea edulis TaxID=37623 RepID=UPI00209441BC|nr:zinc finger protein 184-like [Ostrea edulis]
MDLDLSQLLQRHDSELGFNNDIVKADWSGLSENNDKDLGDAFAKQDGCLFDEMGDILETAEPTFKENSASETVNMESDDSCECIDIDLDFLGSAQTAIHNEITENIIQISDDNESDFDVAVSEDVNLSSAKFDVAVSEDVNMSTASNKTTGPVELKSNIQIYYQKDYRGNTDMFVYVQDKSQKETVDFSDDLASNQARNTPVSCAEENNTTRDVTSDSMDSKIVEPGTIKNLISDNLVDLHENSNSPPSFEMENTLELKTVKGTKEKQFPKLFRVLTEDCQSPSKHATLSETESLKTAAIFSKLPSSFSPLEEEETNSFIPVQSVEEESRESSKAPSELCNKQNTAGIVDHVMGNADSERRDSCEESETTEIKSHQRKAEKLSPTSQTVNQRTKKLLKKKLKLEQVQVLPKEHFTNKIGFVKDEAATLLKDPTLSAPLLPVGLYKDKKNSQEEEEETSIDISKPCSCNICGKVFLKYSDLEIHIRGHLGDRPYQCNKCEQSFKHSSNLQRHRRIHTGEKPYTCPLCEKSFVDGTQLRKHIRTHNNEKSEFCKICKKGFASRTNLKQHMLTHLDDRPFKCMYCNKGFNKNANLKSHLKIHLGYKPWVCDVCGKEFPEKHRLRMHERIHWVDKPYKCDQCDAQFAQISNLYVHQRKHKGDKPWKCGQCGKCFMMKSHLTQHVKRHTGERQFRCAVCGKEYYGRGEFNRHMRTHTGERNHVCGTCQECFIDTTTLKNHIARVHEDKRFSCNVCNKEFVFKSSLARHVHIHTGIKKHFCTTCGAGFQFQVELRDHVNKHLGHKPHTCDVCGKKFYKVAELNQHKKIHTGEAMIYCECCDKTFNYKQSYTKHCQSERHIRKLNGKGKLPASAKRKSNSTGKTKERKSVKEGGNDGSPRVDNSDSGKDGEQRLDTYNDGIDRALILPKKDNSAQSTKVDINS